MKQNLAEYVIRIFNGFTLGFFFQVTPVMLKLVSFVRIFYEHFCRKFNEFSFLNDSNVDIESTYHNYGPLKPFFDVSKNK